MSDNAIWSLPRKLCFCVLAAGICPAICLGDEAMAEGADAFQLEYRIVDARADVKTALLALKATRDELEEARTAGREDAELQRLQALADSWNAFFGQAFNRVVQLEAAHAAALKRLPDAVAAERLRECVLVRDVEMKVYTLSMALKRFQQEALEANQAEQADRQTTEQRLAALKTEEEALKASLKASAERVKVARMAIVKAENAMLKCERMQTTARSEVAALAKNAQEERAAIELARKAVQKENAEHEKAMAELLAVVRAQIAKELNP